MARFNALLHRVGERSKMINPKINNRMKELKEVEFVKAQEEYIEDGINWGAHKNTVIQADRDDVEQFAMDSFHAGVLFVVNKFGIDWNNRDKTKELIIGMTKDLIRDFLYYQRKECEQLPVGTIEQALKDEKISKNDIVQAFKEALDEHLKA